MVTSHSRSPGMLLLLWCILIGASLPSRALSFVSTNDFGWHRLDGIASAADIPHELNEVSPSPSRNIGATDSAHITVPGLDSPFAPQEVKYDPFTTCLKTTWWHGKSFVFKADSLSDYSTVLDTTANTVRPLLPSAAALITPPGVLPRVAPARTLDAPRAPPCRFL